MVRGWFLLAAMLFALYGVLVGGGMTMLLAYQAFGIAGAVVAGALLLSGFLLGAMTYVYLREKGR